VTPARRAFLFAGVAVAAAAAGAGIQVWRTRGGAADDAAAALLALRLPDLGGAGQDLGQWRGKVLVVNFWATWCAPCREEIPIFVRLQEKYRDRGLQFVGIAIDEPAPVGAFVREFGVNYPVLVGNLQTVEISRKAGNRAGGLPFTLVLDRQGAIARTALGGLKEDQLDAWIGALL
jgi:thiol-disulfide isomerase/thioredoxin